MLSSAKYFSRPCFSFAKCFSPPTANTSKLCFSSTKHFSRPTHQSWSSVLQSVLAGQVQHIKVVLTPLNKVTLFEVLNSQELTEKSHPLAKEAKGSPLRGASPQTPGKGCFVFGVPGVQPPDPPKRRQTKAGQGK